MTLFPFSRISPMIYPIPSFVSFFVLFHHLCSSTSIFFDLSLSAALPKFYPHPPLPTTLSPYFCPKQEVLPDRKRVTTRSYLPITPADTDSGCNFTCVASNPAVPMGKRATVTLNVHRMFPLFPIKVLRCTGWAQVIGAKLCVCKHKVKSHCHFHQLPFANF